MKTIEELTEPKTAAAVLEDMYTVADGMGIPAREWIEGSWLQVILLLLCHALAALSNIRVAFARSGFLGLARGDWLTVLAFYMYDVRRRAATFAPGTITLTNTGTASYVWGVGDLHFAHDVTGKPYTIQTAELEGLLPGQSKNYAILADEAGAASSAVAGSVTTMVTPLLGVAATNYFALFGSDEETDASLVTQCQAKMASVSPNGPKDAFVYVARSTDARFGAQPTAPIERVKTFLEPVTDAHRVLIANAGGNVDAPDVALIQARLDRWASPNTGNAIVASAVPNVYEIEATVTVIPNSLTDAEVENAVALEVASFFRTVPIGGYQYSYVPEDPGVIEAQLIVGQFFEAAKNVVIRVVLDSVTVNGVAYGPEADAFGVPADAVPVLGSLSVNVEVGYA